MIANSAFLAAMVLLVAGFLVLEQLSFLTPYKSLIVQRYLWPIVGAVAVVFVNLVAVCYVAGRRLFLTETGRKLAHVEKQLQAGDTIVLDLAERLDAEE
jgi:hypothetical protein